MNKFSKKLVVLGLLSAIGLSGCASVSGVGGNVVNNTKNGIVYGVGAVALEKNGVLKTCDVTKNKDARCENPDEYELVIVYTRYGYADGAVGVTAIVKKDFPNLNLLKSNVNWASDKAVFVKAKVVAGKFGEILEILPKSDCSWSGAAAMGGTVCHVYNYDYRKDFTGIIFR